MHFTASELTKASELVARHMRRTPQYVWPLLQKDLKLPNTKVWIQHENHTPTGSFKNRGAITYMDWLVREFPEKKGIITATKGNHGQGQALAATAHGLGAVVYVPHGNAVSKNDAMRAFGADLREFGDDFDTAKEEAMRIAESDNTLQLVPPFHKELVRGVATYAFELLQEAPNVETIYVPIGCGSGICGTILARDALGLTEQVEVVGVVSKHYQAAKLSFEAGKMISTDEAPFTLADGMAVRFVVEPAFNIYSEKAARIVSVSDDEIAEAIRFFYHSTHNVAEGAGAASLAALVKESRSGVLSPDKKEVATILCGGNIDATWLVEILQGRTPTSY